MDDITDSLSRSSLLRHLDAIDWVVTLDPADDGDAALLAAWSAVETQLLPKLGLTSGGVLLVCTDPTTGLPMFCGVQVVAAGEPVDVQNSRKPDADQVLPDGPGPLVGDAPVAGSALAIGRDGASETLPPLVGSAHTASAPKVDQKRRPPERTGSVPVDGRVQCAPRPLDQRAALAKPLASASAAPTEERSPLARAIADGIAAYGYSRAFRIVRNPATGAYSALPMYQPVPSNQRLLGHIVKRSDNSWHDAPDNAFRLVTDSAGIRPGVAAPDAPRRLSTNEVFTPSSQWRAKRQGNYRTARTARPTTAC